MSPIHQFVPRLRHGDPVGRHTVRLREALVARGIESRIYVECTDPETAEETQPYVAYEHQSAPGDVLLYQLATASELATWLRGRPEILVVNYHDVAPAELYAPWDNPMARRQLQARAELRELAPRTTLAIAVSAFSEAELREAGYARTVVVPPASMLLSGADPRPSGGTVPAATSSPRGARWLMVGAVSPPQAIELGIMALLVARSHHDHDATLEVVGRSEVPAYGAALKRYRDELGLHDAVTFGAANSDAEIATCFTRSDVVVLSSLHEGFGWQVPEAARAGLPVVANRAGALPEVVVGDAGVLVDAQNPYELAAAVTAVLGDRSRRERLVPPGANQVGSLDLSRAGDRAVELVASLRP